MNTLTTTLWNRWSPSEHDELLKKYFKLPPYVMNTEKDEAIDIVLTFVGYYTTYVPINSELLTDKGRVQLQQFVKNPVFDHKGTSTSFPALLKRYCERVLVKRYENAKVVFVLPIGGFETTL